MRCHARLETVPAHQLGGLAYEPSADHPDGASTSMLHRHGDSFDLPAGATLLAGSAACPHQAFTRGEAALAL